MRAGATGFIIFWGVSFFFVMSYMTHICLKKLNFSTHLCSRKKVVVTELSKTSRQGPKKRFFVSYWIFVRSTQVLKPSISNNCSSTFFSYSNAITLVIRHVVNPFRFVTFYRLKGYPHFHFCVLKFHRSVCIPQNPVCIYLRYIWPNLIIVVSFRIASCVIFHIRLFTFTGFVRFCCVKYKPHISKVTQHENATETHVTWLAIICGFHKRKFGRRWQPHCWSIITGFLCSSPHVHSRPVEGTSRFVCYWDIS